jgi:hypothetical protein
MAKCLNRKAFKIKNRLTLVNQYAPLCNSAPGKPIIRKESFMLVKILRWSARIIMILAVLFMVMFSTDVFEMEASWKEKLLGFLIHNIPALILALILGIAWKKELAGGILIIIATFMMMLKFNAFTSNRGALVIFVPFVVAGLLFIISHFLSRSEKDLPEKGEHTAG